MKVRPSSLERKLRLRPAQLRRRIGTEQLPSAKAYSRHRTHIIGQDRAIAALELGLRMESPGYNIYLSGPSGTGRMTTVRHLLETFKQPRKPLRDYVYVYNFQEPDRPRLLLLNPGQGVRLKKAMENLLKLLHRELPRAVSTEHCQKERDRVLSDYQRREHELVSGFQERVRLAKFMVVEVQSGPVVEHDVLPVFDGEPRTLAVLDEMVDAGKLKRETFRQLERKHNRLRGEMEQIQRRTRAMARELTERLEEIDRRTGSAVIDALVADIRDVFREESVQDFLDEAREALLERIPTLVHRGEEDPGDGERHVASIESSMGLDPMAPFQINVILNNARRKGCPVVFEHTPTIGRLFGTIERAMDDSGRLEADYMAIRAGALLRANGGFLVVQAEDLLSEPGVWKALKRALATSELEIRLPEGPMTMVTSALKPAPIPLDVKIILMGDEELYRVMYLAEDDFKKTFKVKAEFDIEMDFTGINLEKFIAFVNRVVRDESLLPPVRSAVAYLVELAMRDAEDQTKVSTRFRVTADLLRESDYWARQANRRSIGPADIERTERERHLRFNLAEEKYRESIVRDLIKVDTRGARIGQVNGLAVFDLGDYSFGKPCRITASAGPGRRGVLNIERESGLSGELHDKGVYILTGFLRARFGQIRPLSLDASICFEQSYSEIDGDSASSTEVYAVLSCLSNLPIRQGIAVTGSVDQQGHVQPIGGVNHKVEGFFDICCARGLTGDQGVIIPRANLPHMMLRREVVSAVREGRFQIWAVQTVDEGIELLTGVPAGRPDRRGHYPPATVNRLVADRLIAMAEAMKDFR